MIWKFNKQYTWLILSVFFVIIAYTTHCALCKPLLTAFYYPGNRPIDKFDLEMNKSALAHLNVLIYSPSIYGLQPSGDTYRLAPTSNDNLKLMAAYIHQHKFSVKLMMSLGYWNPAVMRRVITVPATRERFISSIIDTLKNPAYGLKGIDLDWENEYSPVKNEDHCFPIFVKELAFAMQRHGLVGDLLTVDVPPNHINDFPSPKKWIRYVNWVNLMGYDFYGDTLFYTELDSTLGYNTLGYSKKPPNYQNISLMSTLQTYKERGIPNSKMVVILPTYGAMSHVQYTTEAYHYGLRQRIIGSHTPTYYPYWKIYTEYGTYQHPKDGYSAHEYIANTPEGHHFASFWLTKGTQFISYPDPIAIKQDAEYLVAQHYLGISIWELSDSVNFDNPDSLLRIIAKAERRV